MKLTNSTSMLDSALEVLWLIQSSSWRLMWLRKLHRHQRLVGHTHSSRHTSQRTKITFISCKVFSHRPKPGPFLTIITHYGLHPAWDNPKYTDFFFLLFLYFCMINMFVFLVGHVHSGLRAKNIKATSWLSLPGLLSPHYSQNIGHLLQKNTKNFCHYLIIWPFWSLIASLVSFWIYVRYKAAKISIYKCFIFVFICGGRGVRNRTDPPLGSNSIYSNIKPEL